MAASVLVVSDSHLSDRAPQAVVNWRSVISHVAAHRPDLVVHLGDASLDGVSHPDELLATRAWMDELAVPWRAVPGNHDVGDDPGAGPQHADINEERRARWTATFGPDWWTIDVAAWTVIGLDAQLLGSELDAEAEQWAWLEETLAATDPHRPTLLAIHKPLDATPRELAGAPPRRFVGPGPRQRIRTLWEGRPPPLTVSGHVHQTRDLRLEDRRHLWAPSTWGFFAEDRQRTVGEKRGGVLALGLLDDGTVRSSVEAPDGFSQLTVGVDTADPFA